MEDKEMEEIVDDLDNKFKAWDENSKDPGSKIQKDEKVYANKDNGGSVVEKLVDVLEDTEENLDLLSKMYREKPEENVHERKHVSKEKLVSKSVQLYHYRSRYSKKDRLKLIVAAVAIVALIVPLTYYTFTSMSFLSPISAASPFQVSSLNILDAGNRSDIQAQVSKITIYGSEKATADVGSLVFMKTFDRSNESIAQIDTSVEEYINDNEFMYLSMLIEIDFDNVVYGTKFFELHRGETNDVLCYPIS